jgi:hypothetical protein
VSTSNALKTLPELPINSPDRQRRPQTLSQRSEDDPMAKKTNGKTKKVRTRRYRDSLTGRFVTKKYAKKHPKTTQKESKTPA